MSTHAEFYTDLLRRRCTGDPTLSLTQHRELDLHLLICLKCNFEYAQYQAERAPQTGATLLQALEAKLAAARIAPYLPALAEALYSNRPLTAFEAWLEL